LREQTVYITGDLGFPAPATEPDPESVQEVDGEPGNYDKEKDGHKGSFGKLKLETGNLGKTELEI
jgi:hypothetical protein